MHKRNKISNRPVILFFIGKKSYFFSHRLPTARAAIASGYDVHIIAADTGLADSITLQDVYFHTRWFGNDRVALLSIVIGFIQLVIFSLCLRTKIVQVVGIRYALIGLFAALFLPFTRIIFSINGLGLLFVKEKSNLYIRVARNVILSLFRIIASFRKIEITFQNNDDLNQFVQEIPLRRTQIYLIRGSGVDTERYHPTALPPLGPITFGVASRMLRMKGIQDIITAFRQLIDEGYPVKLLLAGDIDEANPDSLNRDEIKAQCSDGAIEWQGYLSDVKSFWEACHVAMLGSHGGEGLPMTLLIPAAMTRPILCSDTNGNRDLIDDGVNGYLFPKGDIDAIKIAVKSMLDADLSEMGKASLQLIYDRKMDAASIYDQFAALYQS